MAGIYGHRWTSSYGESDEDGTWAVGLSGLTGRDLARGLNDCMKREGEWPPTLPQFRRMCMEYSVPEHRPFPPAERLVESDAHKEHKKATAKKWRDKWIEMGLMPRRAQ